MTARAIPLKTDSITFKNWAPAGSGATSLHARGARDVGHDIIGGDPFQKPLRYMPRCSVPRQIDSCEVVVLLKNKFQQLYHLLRILFFRVEMCDLIGGQFERGRHN